MDFVWKLYGNTYAVHVTVALVGVATLNLALPPPLGQPPPPLAPSHFEKAGYAPANETAQNIIEFEHGHKRQLLSRSTIFMVYLLYITCKALTGGNWQKWKRVFLTCPCHEIYRDEAVGLKSCKNTWKIMIFVKMWNLGQYRENLIFCQ